MKAFCNGERLGNRIKASGRTLESESLENTYVSYREIVLVISIKDDCFLFPLFAFFYFVSKSWKKRKNIDTSVL